MTSIKLVIMVSEIFLYEIKLYFSKISRYVEFQKFKFFRNGKIKTGMELWDNKTDDKERGRGKTERTKEGNDC